MRRRYKNKYLQYMIRELVLSLSQMEQDVGCVMCFKENATRVVVDLYFGIEERG